MINLIPIDDIRNALQDRRLTVVAEKCGLSGHYKINQQKIDKEIDQMLSADHPLIMIREESRSIRLTNLGRNIIR